MIREKEYLYIGHYTTVDNKYILKIGTTNDLQRRKQEHERNYKRAKQFTMPEWGTFDYDFKLKLSKYNTLRYEDKNRNLWQSLNIGQFIRNDRFYCPVKPPQIIIIIRKTYVIKL